MVQQPPSHLECTNGLGSISAAGRLSALAKGRPSATNVTYPMAYSSKLATSAWRPTSFQGAQERLPSTSLLPQQDMQLACAATQLTGPCTLTTLITKRPM